MHLKLEVKRYHEFFWLRSVRSVNIYRCCAECLIGQKDNRIYYGTLHKATAVIDVEVNNDPQALAYYLCGLSAGYNWSENTHVAFVPALGEKVEIDNDNIRLEITDAHRVDFASYKPKPYGFFSYAQRTCRNWIFANYVNDGMLQGGQNNGNE